MRQEPILTFTIGAPSNLSLNWHFAMPTFTPLGTASAVPAHGRHLSAALLTHHGRHILFDCGEGTQYRLHAVEASAARINVIAITHLHGDHCYGLPGLLSSMALQQRTNPLTCIGPPGLKAWLAATPGASPAELPFACTICEMIPPPACTTVWRGRHAWLEARALDHRVPVMGYRWTTYTRTGPLDVERARALGVSHPPDFGRLKEGTPVTTDDGTRVRPDDVVGPPHPGVSCAYITDTRPGPGSRALAQRAHLAYHDATFGSEHAARATETGHSTAAEAAQIARTSGTHRLLLGHLSARYEDWTPLEAEARRIHPNTEGAREGHAYPIGPAN